MDKEDLKFDFEITKEDFAFVQQDVKIHDKKFETKPTTFFKDAFKRFCKNKSSVVGAIILGILILLAIFVPALSKANTTKVSLDESFLAPKLFKSGTGFWDGTKKYTNIIYDLENEEPAGFVKRAIIEGSLKVDTEPSYVNSVSKYGKGGYCALINENEYVEYDSEDYADEIFAKNTYFFKPVVMKATDNITVNIVFLDEVYPDTVQTSYRLSLLYNDDDDELILLDWTNNLEELNLNISDALAAAGLDEVNAKFNISVKAGNKQRSSLLIKSLKFESDGATKDKLDEYSFASGNEVVLRAQDEKTREYPSGYWQSTGQKNVYQVEVYFCSFTYDTYEAAYGFMEVTVTATDINKYIQQGLIKYDYKVGPESFELLDDSCPIKGVVSQTINSRTKKLLEVKALQYKYLQLGYNEPPKFLFGTDKTGKDTVKYAFSGLRTSLILGVCTAAFCFAFGICWGAVSGYFGGNVDLFMERFCDILAGVPWIVIMTLFILHLGSNFFTFFLALCLTGWMGTAGRTRTQFYRFKGREYVLASRTLGSSDIRLIFRHILPNAIGTIITGAVLMIPSVIFSEATLAYLQLGLQNLDSFGVMLSSNQKYIQVYPHLILFPAVIMSLMMISFNLFGNGLRDAFNPSLKGGEM